MYRELDRVVFGAGGFASVNFPLWLGGIDGVQTHVCHWTTGEPFTYTNWYPGQSDDVGGVEDYIRINWDYANGQGTDYSNRNDNPRNGKDRYAPTTNGPYFGIIEAAPEPSQTAALALGLTVLMFTMTGRAYVL